MEEHKFHLHYFDPKDRPTKVQDFRPISLLTSAYKIPSKVLVNRLYVVSGDTISISQSALVHNCQILDPALVANETVDDVKRWRNKGVVFKMDFEKAYDTVGTSWIQSWLGMVLETSGVCGSEVA